MAASVKSDEERNEDWMKQYNKKYKTEAEKEIRFRSFQINLRDIDAHLANTNLKSHTKGFTQYSDLTIDEFFREILGCSGCGGCLDDSDEDEDEEEEEEGDGSEVGLRARARTRFLVTKKRL